MTAELLQERRERARGLCTDLDLDALLITSRENLRYLCGFTGSDGCALLTPSALIFLTDPRYTTQARAQVPLADCREYRLQAEGVTAALREQGLKRIGFESTIPYGKVTGLREKGEPAWVWLPLPDELDRLRWLKSPDEVALIAAAAEMHRAAFAAVEQLLRPGTVEHDLALELEIALKRHGADDKAFDIIVASGERGALPHGIAGDRRLQAGELVTIDFGARVAGYHADETVTVAIGEVAGEMRTVFDLVLAAHDRAIAAIAPGVPLLEIDRLARELITAAGYGGNFGHGLGHGIGLAVHEGPTVSPRSMACAEPGMVFTVEPGVYLPGLGGVRIEDTVLVTEQGCRVLTRVPKHYRSLSQ